MDVTAELRAQAPEWAARLGPIAGLEALGERLAGEETFFPPRPEVFNALRLTAPDGVRVVILGQDPYHQPGYAHGLAFSVREGNPTPASLRNIFKELAADLDEPPRTRTDLSDWAAQGVLLLNTVMTVRPHTAGAHRGWGWEALTDELIRIAAASAQPSAFVLWGAQAQAKKALIAPHHLVMQSPHPSPLSARRGFFGSRPFSRVNAFLDAPVDWTG